MTKTKNPLAGKNQSWRHLENLIPTTAKNVHMIGVKHQQIVDGACRVFLRKGYHPTTIREIAKESDMSMGQLYHYISCKDDVLFLVHKHLQKMWFEYLRNSSIEKIEDPFQLFIAALRHTLDFIGANKKLWQFVYTESKYLNKKYLGPILETDKRDFVGFWNRLLSNIRKGKQKLNKIDQEFAANLIAYLMVFFALRGWNLRDTSKKKSVNLLIDFILRGMNLSS